MQGERPSPKMTQVDGGKLDRVTACHNFSSITIPDSSCGLAVRVNCSLAGWEAEALKARLRGTSVDAFLHPGNIRRRISEQTELLKDFYPCIFREDEARPALTLPVQWS